MTHTKTVAIIGGTGKAGKYLLQKIAQLDFNVRALVRNTSHIEVNSKHVSIIPGDVKQPDTVDTLFQGCDAVISTLGFGIPPDEPTVFSIATRNILSAMQKHGIKRYVVITGLNVNVAGDNKSEKTRFATDWMYEHYPRSTKDRQLEYQLLAASDLEWTMVRLPMIEQTETMTDIVIDLSDCPSEKISVASLAHFLITQLNDKSFIGKAPFIGNA